MAVRAVDIATDMAVGAAWGGRATTPRREVRSRRAWRWRWRFTPRVWGRVALVLLVPVAVLVMARAAAGATASRPAAVVETVRVAPGDTLWSIALRHAPAGTDPRPWIFRTAALNGLHDAQLMPGEVLRLPAGSR